MKLASTNTTTQQLQQSVSTKPLNCNSNNIRNTSILGSNNVCYEPKSVLDLQRSPSPTAADEPPSNTNNSTATKTTKVSAASEAEDPALQLEDQLLSSYFEEWDSDSFMKELGLHLHDENETPPITHCEPELHFQPIILPELPPVESLQPQAQPLPFNPNPNQFVPSDFTLSEIPSTNIFENTNTTDFYGYNNQLVGYEFVDELIRVAECFETNSIQLAQLILARLNHKLRYPPTGNPLQRAGFYFKEALQSLLTRTNNLPKNPHSSDIVQTIEAFKTFSNISPIIMFSSFTTNQAILEAVDGAMLVHAIDFDIGFGDHWASFIKEFAEKADYRKSNQPAVRITAVVPEEFGLESRLITVNLGQFARDLNIGFEIDFVSIRTFEYLSFKAIKFVEGEKTAVVLSPAIFRRVGPGFPNDLRRVSPHVIVHMDNEGLMGYGGAPPSFGQIVIDGLKFYSAVLESLEAANLGGGSDWMRRIEVFVLLPQIMAAVEGAVRGGTPWREALAAAGIWPVGLSRFADFQAEGLLRRVQVRGFHVAKRQHEMVLCWRDRPLVATSAWRC